ncbi:MULTISPECIES: hypothetical protein [unclassified Nostoc]|uniref:hypothetical protein n=1 Tax=unclassified Nostoc TaxID=2593658 RepID=UPI002AD4101A|nr:hypothetical protein [Nostoc sp. DedQUE03]MDZ7975950.1 hypothetical protein [Nostoc sp. DedQUE03]MDZ8044785.1 hypothetical protein [Nostoc sp. DedQUE02]
MPASARMGWGHTILQLYVVFLPLPPLQRQLPLPVKTNIFERNLVSGDRAKHSLTSCTQYHKAQLTFGYHRFDEL